ncbi:paraquat-inducible protein A [Paraglaciecola sp.]|uniref:paraquat-inducible protein A n=1 Tax=Paraglaciecola sp. TaxID=1920173 RepID=UPI003267D02F
MTSTTVQNAHIDYSNKQITRCHDCHLEVKIPSLAHKKAAYCPRCKLQLSVFHQDRPQKLIAFAITGILLLVASLLFEFLSFSTNGQTQSIDLLDSFKVLIDKNYEVLAFLQAIFMLLLPGAILVTLLYVLPPPELEFRLPRTEAAVNFIFIPWAMAKINNIQQSNQNNEA